MDYENNKRYIQKSNTGFWVIGIFTFLLSAYMAYTHFMEFANAGYNAVDSYVYGFGGTIDQHKRLSSSSSAILNFIYGILFLLLMLTSIVSILKRSMRSLGICFLSAIVLSVLIFFVDEFFIST